MQLQMSYEFVQQVDKYLKERRIGHDPSSDASTALTVESHGSVEQLYLLRSDIEKIENDIAQELDEIKYKSKFPLEDEETSVELKKEGLK